MKTDEIAKQNAPTPDNLLLMAVQSNLDLDKLERLMELRQKWLAEQARKAYYVALSGFQAEIPVITKSKKVDFPLKDSNGRITYNYAPLDVIVSAIKTSMQNHGLSYRWEQMEEKDMITITCIITHVDGHSEKMTMYAGADTSGKKNNIQQKASTVTYLRRYTLTGSLGIATADDDIDAVSVAATSAESKKILAEKQKQIAAYKTATEINLNYKQVIKDAEMEGMNKSDLKTLQDFINTTYKNKKAATLPKKEANEKQG